MATAVDTKDIVRGEDRNCRFSFSGALPTGAAAWAYSLVLTQTKGGAAVVTKTFGAADYNAGTEQWDFTIAAASTALLTYGLTTYATVRRTDSGYNQVLKDYTLTVG